MKRATASSVIVGGRFLLLIAASLVILDISGWASLGDKAESVLNDSAHMGRAFRSTSKPTHIEREFRTPNGQVVREFVTLSGRTFGVAWEGPLHPDFRQLLGSYFEPMRRSISTQVRRGHGPLFIHTPSLVFQQSGHMRAFRGRAYVPDLVPEGVDVRMIQ